MEDAKFFRGFCVHAQQLRQFFVYIYISKLIILYIVYLILILVLENQYLHYSHTCVRVNTIILPSRVKKVRYACILILYGGSHGWWLWMKLYFQGRKIPSSFFGQNSAYRSYKWKSFPYNLNCLLKCCEHYYLLEDSIRCLVDALPIEQTGTKTTMKISEVDYQIQMDF